MSVFDKKGSAKCRSWQKADTHCCQPILITFVNLILNSILQSHGVHPDFHNISGKNIQVFFDDTFCGISAFELHDPIGHPLYVLLYVVNYNDKQFFIAYCAHLSSNTVPVSRFFYLTHIIPTRVTFKGSQLTYQYVFGMWEEALDIVKSYKCLVDVIFRIMSSFLFTFHLS